MFDISKVAHGTTVNITYDTPLRGSDQLVEVLSTGGYKAAMEYEDVNAIHQNIYSSLEAVPPNNLREYNFLIFLDQNGKKRAVADAWIRNVAVVKKVKARFEVELDNVAEIDEVRRALAIRGLSNISVDVIEN